MKLIRFGVLTFAICTAVAYTVPVYAVYKADPVYANRSVYNVTASSIAIRTQPNSTAPLITTQVTGKDQVETVPNENTIATNDYEWLQFDYVSSASNKYSDNYSGYGTTENLSTLTNLVQSVNTLYNYTATADNVWAYSDLTSAIGTIGAGVTYKTRWVQAADDNPNAWLIDYNGTHGYVNGWYVNGGQS